VAAGVHQAPPSLSLARGSRRISARKGPTCAGLLRAAPPGSLAAARPVVPMVRCRRWAATPVRVKTRARREATRREGATQINFFRLSPEISEHI